MNIFVIIFIHFYFIDEKSQLHMVKLNDNHDPTVSFINLICLSQWKNKEVKDISLICSNY